ncbi:hypothetical protein OESDEN_10317 [Oesophagostomum dentatum]|uniref:Endonuclease/exonuclease/phosphatase domain-containing protein n=1 Tax=Oesophagostomum dentatum TaxID=61180 RepID=A0A0B1T222_OESDE|nr:hypothetical protein OESDEN_10317 [Oesophagostomum dentatum]
MRIPRSLYSKLRKSVVPCFYTFVAGDFNARIGTAAEAENRIGRFGLGLRNESGNRLVGLLSAARLFHGNSIFMEREHRRWTCYVSTQPHDSRGDRPHTHQPKVVSTGCFRSPMFLLWF